MGFLFQGMVYFLLRASYWNVMGLVSCLLSFENPSWNYLMSKHGISQCEIHCWLRMQWGIRETSLCQGSVAVTTGDLSRIKGRCWSVLLQS